MGVIHYIYGKTYFEDCGLLERDLHNFVTVYFHFPSSYDVQVYTFFPGFKNDMQPYTTKPANEGNNAINSRKKQWFIHVVIYLIEKI